MTQQLFQQVKRLTWVALLTLVIVLGSQTLVGQATPQQSFSTPPMIRNIYEVNCTSLASITPTYAKLADLGTFTVQSADSVVEAAFNGRIFVSSFSSGTGAVFELRVDDMPTAEGRARANLRQAEAGVGGVQTSITGFFSGLPAGEHTASMWVRTSAGGSGTQAMVDPGCWSTDVLIVKEYLPFGFVYLPSVLND